MVPSTMNRLRTTLWRPLPTSLQGRTFVSFASVGVPRGGLDLVAGADNIIFTMMHTSKDGGSKPVSVDEIRAKTGRT